VKNSALITQSISRDWYTRYSSSLKSPVPISLPPNPSRSTRTHELSRRGDSLPPGNFTIARGLKRTFTLCVLREYPRHLDALMEAHERDPYASARANRPDEARKTLALRARTRARARARRAPAVLLYFTLVDAETPG